MVEIDQPTITGSYPQHYFPMTDLTNKLYPLPPPTPGIESSLSSPFTP